MPAAEVRVHPLTCGTAKAPPAFLRRPDGPASGPRAILSALAPRPGRWLALPLPAFLVEHPDEGPFLVDTGISGRMTDGARADLGLPGAIGLSVDLAPDRTAAAQVRALGVDPAGLERVVMTHLHYDHLGGAEDFPAATFVVDERELAEPAHFSKGTYDHHRDAVRQWQVVRPGGLDAPLDLFGDGSVRLVSTPGHTPGHLSVLLRLAGGREALLTGDAAYARRTLEERWVPLICPDRERYLASLDALRAYVAARPADELVVVCGHDPWAWGDATSALAA